MSTSDRLRNQSIRLMEHAVTFEDENGAQCAFDAVLGMCPVCMALGLADNACRACDNRLEMTDRSVCRIIKIFNVQFQSDHPDHCNSKKLA